MRKDYQKFDKTRLKLIFFLCLAFPLIQSCSEIPTSRSISEEYDSGSPYLGVVFDQNDTEPGLKVTRILAGPLQQALSESLDINIRSDRLMRVDNQTVTANTFKQLISRYSPGQIITLQFQKNNVETEEKSTVSIEVTLGDKSRWTGPVSKSAQINRFDKRIERLPDISDKNQIREFIHDKTNNVGLTKEIHELYSLFFKWQKNNSGFHSLSRVMFPFQHPEHLFELETKITEPLSNLHVRPESIFNEIAANLDLINVQKKSCHSTSRQWNTLLESIDISQQLLNTAFTGFNKKQLNILNDNFAYLLNELSKLNALEGQSKLLRLLNAMNASMEIDFNALLNAAATFQCFLNRELTINLPSTVASKNIPYELREAIIGEIHTVINVDTQWVVFGGDNENTYDMSIIDVVYDPAGNDTYKYSKPDPVSLKLVIDKTGDDKYVSDDIGPVTGWLGTSLLIDHQGNDSYRGNIAANGTGMMGIGILIDYSGKDTFTGNHFSNGAAYYGAGILLDLGNEGDVHHSTTFSQGFGGPRGFGLLYDHNGNDLYRANGLSPSVYGTDAVYVSFSQGIGFGLRHYDSGGIGVIYDAQGSDRYEGGEFSQAGAYYWGLGIIHDDAGNDNYYGNRYSQGFGVHQATGILFDKQGNDNYWGMTAACQGAAWDVAMGLLLDIEGNDTYRGDNLCQGSAAMQAMGWLIDLDGSDHYTANSQSAQGHSGNNTYHYDPETPVYSWSMLLDTGGKQDFYSNDRGNNQTIRYSELNEDQAADSLMHGLFIDTQKRFSLY